MLERWDTVLTPLFETGCSLESTPFINKILLNHWLRKKPPEVILPTLFTWK